MKPLSFTRTYTVDEKPRDLFGEQLTAHFKKPMYGIYKRALNEGISRAHLERCFDIVKKKGDTDITHFMQLVWHG